MGFSVPDDGRPQTLLIDNFDSFTWNLYQYLCILGANVTVVRNDAITEIDFPNLHIANLIVSPGPGHPQTDSGISRQAIRYFSGKVPVLGVCMGLECLVDEYGGTIAYAGEIMHGKTSKIRHDGKGVFLDVPQGIPSTRYHSLSANVSTLPDILSVTATTQESGVIMGVRHREYTVEAVQYHPESIMSEQGSALLKNFLELKGGTWADNPRSQVPDPRSPGAKATSRESAAKIPSILEKIHTQRLKDVAAAKQTPGARQSDLERYLTLNLAPTLLPVIPRIKNQRPALMAEIKRASPSKGPIAISANAAEQALVYALAGASVISVLTEPTWFKGSLMDMQLVRQAIETLQNRPAVLRKDFIVDEYQIVEARLHGADTVLLIVAILPPHRLRQLYHFSLSIGMEPLVEVNNAAEMQTALEVGAKLVGVNNRNLHDFEVDMSTTTRLADACAGRDVILCALSGISGPEDVQKYVEQGIAAVLVGESLMRAPNPASFVKTLLGHSQHRADVPPKPPLVKICGVRDPKTAIEALEAGADMIGLIFVPNSKRKVSFEAAREISLTVRSRRSMANSALTATGGSELEGDHVPDGQPSNRMGWFGSHAEAFGAGPYVVGVFQDQPLEDILAITNAVQLDIVQIHGREPVDWARRIPVPVIKVCHLPAHDDPASVAPSENTSSASNIASTLIPGYHRYILLDSVRPGGTKSGGSGTRADLGMAKAIIDAGEYPSPSQMGFARSVNALARDLEVTLQTGSALPQPAALRDPLAPIRAENRGREGWDGGRTSNLSSDERLPIILAGGLTLENVTEVINSVHPWAVDVSGGVEAEGSVEKDPAKIRAFVKAVKSVGDDGTRRAS